MLFTDDKRALSCRQSFFIILLLLQALTLPLDTAKVRLQLQAKSSGPPLYK